MGSRRLPLALPVALALIVVLGFLLRVDPDPAQAPIDAGPEPGPVATDAPELPHDPGHRAGMPKDRPRSATRPDRGPLPPHTVLVHVLDPEGRPVPRAEAILWISGSGGSLRTRDTVREGRLHVELDDGYYARVEVLCATSADGDPLPLGPAVTPRFGSDAGEVFLHLPAELTMEGRVVDDAGEPAAGVLLRAEPRAFDPETSFFQSRISGAPHGTAETGRDGRFRLRGLGEVHYELFVSRDDRYAPFAPVIRAAGRTDVRLVLRRSVRPVVTVIGPDDSPVVGARVRVWVPEDGLAFPFDRRTDEAGQVVAGGLEPDGKYWLAVDPPPPAENLVPFEEDGWTPHDTRVRLERGRVVTGRLVDEDGRPTAGVLIWSPEGEESWKSLLVDDGSFRIGRVPPGKVVLIAGLNSRDLQGKGRPRTVVEAGAGEVVIRLVRGLSLSVRFENWPEGAHQVGPVNGVIKSADGETGSILRLLHEGRLVLDGLDPAVTVTLLVHGPGGESAWLGRDLVPGGAEILARLAPLSSIRGRIPAPEGAKEIEVFANIEGLTRKGRVEPDGTFEIPGLAEGEWTVSATAKTEEFLHHTTKRVQAGSVIDLPLTEKDRLE